MGYDPTPEQQAEWDAWLATRPESIQSLGRRFFPWIDYRVIATGQRAYLRSFSEPDEQHPDGSITAVCWQEWCPELTARTVFGFSPEDLELWPTPTAGPHQTR